MTQRQVFLFQYTTIYVLSIHGKPEYFGEFNENTITFKQAGYTMACATIILPDAGFSLQNVWYKQNYFLRYKQLGRSYEHRQVSIYGSSDQGH